MKLIVRITTDECIYEEYVDDTITYNERTWSRSLNDQETSQSNGQKEEQ